MSRKASIRSILCLGLVVFMTACATTPDEMVMLEKSFFAYERAMRWQDYDLLIAFHKNEQQSLTPEKRQYLKQFRVTGYNVVHSSIAADQKHASQIIEIRYHSDASVTIKNLTLNNNWEYDEATQRWQLTNPIPQFK